MDSIRAGLVTVATAVLLLPLGATEAAAQDVACGKVVTESITLEDNLDCPAGTNGLTIGADAITVNLNGHKISGRPGANGIDNSDGHNDLRIVGEDGSIRGFTNGLEIRGAGRIRVSSLTLQDNAENGLKVLDSRDGRFSDLQVVGNHGDGAVFGDGADRNEIRKTSFTGNNATGLVVVGDGNTVTGNWSNDNGGNGFTIRSADTTVRSNIANANKKRGIDAVDGTSDAGDNHATGNAGDLQCTGVTC